MQISQTAQTSHLHSINDLYDLDIELKAIDPSINPHKDVNLGSHGGHCTMPSNCYGCSEYC
ncbi:MAG: hypothetical protein ACRCU0_01700 [Candidatus Rhabdochlamydia sp.]